jgi:hypothetical protein
LINTLENGTNPEKAWSGRMLSCYENLKAELPFTVQRISLGDMFHIIAMSGEIWALGSVPQQPAPYIKTLSF